MITHAELLDWLSYDPDTGMFLWRKFNRKMKPGTPAGTWSCGYLTIRVAGERYSGHRLAWFYVYGEWPEELIDHINQNPSDNRIANLRPANKWQNSANSKNRQSMSGVRGVYHNSKSRWGVKRWHAYINHNGQRTNLGVFMTKEEAAAARWAAEKIYHREYAPPSRRRASAPEGPSKSLLT